MGLNKARGNMYDFITHTWNVIKGQCFHDCSYCYMKKWGELNLIHMDDKELKTSLGTGNYIFVGSSNDMWAERVPDIWIKTILAHINKYPENKYMFQSKNPMRFFEYDKYLPKNCITGTTIETNRIYPCMGNTPPPDDRAEAMDGRRGFITIEPILDFDIDPFFAMLKNANPASINIGADTQDNHLPEPPRGKIIELIAELQKFTVVKKKSNLLRLVGAVC